MIMIYFTLFGCLKFCFVSNKLRHMYNFVVYCTDEIQLLSLLKHSLKYAQMLNPCNFSEVIETNKVKHDMIVPLTN